MYPPHTPRTRPVRRPLGWRALALALGLAAAVPAALVAVRRPPLAAALVAAAAVPFAVRRAVR